ncbi:hypothetical protein AMIS_61410 [Actinoplanes missouriensis 431]|uniref:DUF1304 domain-containing protein n=2 Tax=Actinoplanes missouriensis TaxID=1866 RepID=I0HEC4_ACTM4|nr:hypothetical protein AMIS_61410 [Actinoplanes missouriensis 431]
MLRMNTVAQVFAVVAALVHLGAGTLEAFFYRRPAVRKFLTGSTADAPEAQMWRFFIGLYNLFLAVGILVGLVMLHRGDESAGRALVIYVGCFMTVSGVIFLITHPKLWSGALGQFVPPGAAVAAALLT